MGFLLLWAFLKATRQNFNYPKSLITVIGSENGLMKSAESHEASMQSTVIDERLRLGDTPAPVTKYLSIILGRMNNY